MRNIISVCAMTLASFVPPVSAKDPPPATERQLQIVNDIDIMRQPIPPERRKTAYLLVYFKEHLHSLHFAISKDGYRFTDVNDGAPVLSGAVIATQKGIRDPYLMRGPDGVFYMTMTDLHIYAQQEGIRATRWERPAETYGWGNNRAIILARSRDLIHWTHAEVDLTRKFASYRDMGIAWAPEVFYDPKRGRMMVYFSTRMRNGLNSIVYAYADARFKTLIAPPEKLFDLPRDGKSAVDGDITRIGKTYHLFFSTDDGSGNIRQAMSKDLTGGYVYEPAKVDRESVGTEAPMLWKRHGTNRYVLMYDVYAAKPNNMGFSETTDFRTFTPIGHFNDPGSPMTTTNFTSPKHGSITAITVVEADRLQKYFKR